VSDIPFRQNSKLVSHCDYIVTKSESIGKGLPTQIVDEFKVLQKKIDSYYLLKLQSKAISTQSIDDLFLRKPLFSKDRDIRTNQKLILFYIEFQQFIQNSYQGNDMSFEHQTFAIINETIKHQALCEPINSNKGSMTIPDCDSTQQKVLGAMELFYDFITKLDNINDVITLSHLLYQALPSYGLWSIARGAYLHPIATQPNHFLETLSMMIEREIDLMQSYLQLPYLHEKLMHYIDHTRSSHYHGEPLSKHTEILTKELLLRGEIKRGEVQKVIGKEQRTATTLIGELLKQDYITTNSPKGAIRLKFNLQIALSVFPQLIES